MHVVLFLGAGSSRAFGLPVMCEFFQAARNHPEIAEADRNVVVKLQAGSRRVQGTLSGPEKNLEHVLSVAWAGGAGEGTELYEKVARVIYHVYKRPGALPAPRDIAQPLGRLLGFDVSMPDGRPSSWFNENKLDIITTNYDVLTEFALSWMRQPPFLPFEWRQQSESTNRYPPLYSRQPSPVRLYKLHGSLNWFCGSSDKIEVEDQVTDITTQLPPDEKTAPWPTIGAKNFAAASSPLLVPPTFFKNRLHEKLEPVWRAAHQVLRTADKLAFVGYSFPPSDVQMRYFIGSALGGNVNLDRIDVVDPAANTIVANLQREDSILGPSLRDMFVPCSTKWEEAEVVITR